MLTQIEMHEECWKSGTRSEITTRWNLWRLTWAVYWRVFLIHAAIIVILMCVLGGGCGLTLNPEVRQMSRSDVSDSVSQSQAIFYESEFNIYDI